MCPDFNDPYGIERYAKVATPQKAKALPEMDKTSRMIEFRNGLVSRVSPILGCRFGQYSGKNPLGFMSLAMCIHLRACDGVIHWSQTIGSEPVHDESRFDRA